VTTPKQVQRYVSFSVRPDSRTDWRNVVASRGNVRQRKANLVKKRDPEPRSNEVHRHAVVRAKPSGRQ
jgi:hypothetical protein